MKNKILHYIGVSVLVVALMSSIVSPSVAIGSTPIASDDGYEENDDFASAAYIYEGYYYDLEASDDDWYYFYVDYGDVIDVYIYFSHSQNDLDLALFDSSNSGLDLSTSTTDDEHVSWTAAYTGYYYIQVYFNTLGYLYDLEIDLTTGDPDPIVNYDYTEEPDPYFDYGVNEDDEYIYNVIFDVDFTASNTFYEQVDEYIIDMADDDDYVSLSDDFSSKAIIEDLEDIVQQDFDLQIIINDMYNDRVTCSWTSGEWYVQGEYMDFPDGGYYIQNDDIFNAGIAVDIGDGWEGPEVIPLEFLNSFEDIMVPYFEGDFEDDFQEEIGYIEDELQDPPDWDDLDYFEVIMSSREYYYEDDTHIPTDPFYIPEELDVVFPFPEFAGMYGVPAFLPMDMNFEDYYNFLDDLLVETREWCDDNPYDCEWPDEISDIFNLGDAEEKVGISNIVVQSNAIAISFNLDDVDTELLGLMYFYDDLEEVGIYDFTGTVDYALEYDENWALLSMATYVHGSLTLDWDDIDEAPIDFNEEVLELDAVFTICQDGFYPPSEDQIKDGEIGANRDPSSSAFNIPSYPIAVLGIIGLVSVFALVKKYKK